jgi:hypothetical protein
MRHVLLAIASLGCASAPGSACAPFRVSVEVPGNHALDDAALATIVRPLETVRAGPLAYYDLFGDRLDAAVSGLSAAYYDRGYVNAAVREPTVELSEDRASLRIVLPVSEGERHRVAGVRVVELDEQGETARGHEPTTPHGLDGVRDGDWFSRSRVAEAMQALEALYEEHGYALVELVPTTVLETDPPRVSLRIGVQRGPAFVIDAVEVLDERDGPLRVPTGIAIGERYVGSRVREARRSLEARYPDREVRSLVEARPGSPGHALLRFVLIER